MSCTDAERLVDVTMISSTPSNGASAAAGATASVAAPSSWPNSTEGRPKASANAQIQRMDQLITNLLQTLSEARRKGV
jgi:hypothetical protein